MKLNGLKVSGFALLCLLSLSVAIVIFHCGPFGVEHGEERLLASRRLTNGETLYLIAHRTSSWIEPYQTRLYRLVDKTNCIVHFLTFEDSYWWKCGLENGKSADEIYIKVYGTKVATYSLAGSEVRWLKRNRPNSPGFLIGDQVQLPVPAIIRNELHGGGSPE